MIKKDKKTHLFDLLLKSKNFYGESIKKTKKEISPFIYSNRHDFSIINLKYTSLFIKRIFKLINLILKKDKKILFIHNADDTQFLINENFTKKNKNIIFFEKRWLNGLGTNKKIQQNINFDLNEIQLIFFLKTSTSIQDLSQEFYYRKIPIISLINTDQNIKKINYPIVTNLNHIQSIYILMYLIRKLF